MQRGDDRLVRAAQVLAPAKVSCQFLMPGNIVDLLGQFGELFAGLLNLSGEFILLPLFFGGLLLVGPLGDLGGQFGELLLFSGQLFFQIFFDPCAVQQINRVGIT